jgi:Mlc titration factor MtfA (ptsG expression regulator)
LRRVQLDEVTWSETIERVGFLRALDSAERDRLRELVQLFLDRKRFATAHGLALTESMRMSIACQACMLILNLGFEYYEGWSGVILYPAEFLPRHTVIDEMGVVHQGNEVFSGEAWQGGPVILSWADVDRAGSDDGVNVVIHEFAHKLDMLNGAANGYPPLHSNMKREDWVSAFTSAYHDFCHWVDSGAQVPIDPYASEAPAEFFAVVSEAFFETPEVIKLSYPEVYTQLTMFYRQDPAARTRSHGSS